MSRPKAFLLLMIYILALAVLCGVVHATGCTPDVETHICITTDKTTYNPGETVIVNVEETVPTNTSNVTGSIDIFPVPSCNYIYLSCATASGSIILYPVAAGVWRGTATMRLPGGVAAGNYEVEVFGVLPPGWARNAGIGITVVG